MGGETNLKPTFTGLQADDPDFHAWAKMQGKPIVRTTPYSELVELMARYQYEANEEYSRKQDVIGRLARDAAKNLDRKTDWSANFSPRISNNEDDQLRQKIQAGWKRGHPALKDEARAAVNEGRSLMVWLYNSHGSNIEIDRWTYMRHYLTALQMIGDEKVPTEDILLANVLREEKLYLEKTRRQREALAKSRRPALQLEALKAWARKQPLNPVDDFDDGIAFYEASTASKRTDWMDNGKISVDGYSVKLSYDNGKSLNFSSKRLDFTGKELASATASFLRRHKTTGRLVLFVEYARHADIYKDLPEIDQLSVKDRVYLAVPYLLTPLVLAYFNQDPLLQVAVGIIDILKVMSIYKLLPIGAPVIAGGASTAANIGLRTFGAGRAVAAEVTFAVRTYGMSFQAATYVGRSAYSYYMVNAVALNTHIVVGTEIGFSFAGYDMGPMSLGDTMTAAVQMDDAAKVGAKSWKAIKLEVLEVETATAKARVGVKSIEDITEDVAKSEYNLGKTIKGETKGASKSSRAVDDAATDSRSLATTFNTPRAPIIPLGAIAAGKRASSAASTTARAVVAVDELTTAMNKVVKGLENLASKYNADALNTIRNISAQAIKDSGINPRDLAKLANSLSRVGPTTRKFVNDFHNVPGFEQVLLNWAKRSYWNSRGKTPSWKDTKAFYTGSSYMMKYATAKLDPKFVRFEWPVSINNTRFGDEVTARFVDIVVTGGQNIKPGNTLQIELKSWTEWVLRAKTGSASGATTNYPGTVGYQLIRDTAIFKPENIRWVFDGSKVSKQQVIDAFTKVINGDVYLLTSWGGKGADQKVIGSMLDKVIEVF